MSNPTSQTQPETKPRRKRRWAAVVVSLSAIATATGAIASTQPFSSDNPFESDIPSAINGSGGGSNIAAGEPSIGDLGDLGGLGDIIPSFPGLPGSSFPSSPGGGSGGGGSFGDIFMGGLGNIFGDAGGPAPKIFKDILNGNMGGVLESILSILTSQNDIFGEISSVVLGDGWESADGDGNPDTPPNPYKIRLPQEESDEEAGILTRSPIVSRRDKANQYDQELGRAMAAPMLAEAGDQWLEGNITTSSDMMQAGLASTQSAISKSGEATEATSTQDIVRRSAEISGIAATMQMQEMQQNAMLGESLWNMQRLQSAQLQIAADTSEAADEQNRRDRTSRAAALSSSAGEAMIIPGLADISSAASPTPSAPAAPSFFATP
ncbi:hypothetical protein [cf. Phormidesmis sp. LEGE 11477]|uniref:hypothetical protein n=1 Tax=cf. Phormidesmis sp. LEGE 11477 TaxID=1828680 RepID=UPI0018805511|nr:hypothetical protein [cf. Phormidesmis sp. LEGE 11477]MBE9060320.1 hypothetical protein [cf. Phormidesmis sp. LEGE 11477]